MPKVQIVAEIDQDLNRELKSAADRTDRSVSELVEEAVRHSLHQSHEASILSPAEGTSGVEPIRLRDGTVITNQAEWEAFGKKHPHMHLPPFGEKPLGSQNPVKLRPGSGTVAEAVIEDRGER